MNVDRTEDQPAGEVDGQKTTDTVAAGVISLELGDFLHRIPANTLKAGPHNTLLPLTFERGALESSINSGETTIPLSEIYAQLPDIFKSDEFVNSSVPIRLPYQKLIKLLSKKKSMLPPPPPTEAMETRRFAPSEETAIQPVEEPQKDVHSSAAEDAENFLQASSAAAPSSETAIPTSAPEPTKEIPAEENEHSLVEKLQKRLSALEGMQRASAQELGR